MITTRKMEKNNQLTFLSQIIINATLSKLQKIIIIIITKKLKNIYKQKV
jgi:hypothetical protein